MKVVDLGKRIIEIAQLTGGELVVARSADLIRMGQQPVVIFSGHIYIDIVVPRYKSLVTDGSEECSSRQVIPDPVLLTDLRKDFEESEFSLLHFLQIQFLHFTVIVSHVYYRSVCYFL